MNNDIVELPDEEYRAYWHAFHDKLDWSTHRDVTAVPMTLTGKEALPHRQYAALANSAKTS